MNDFTLVTFIQNPQLGQTIPLKAWRHITLKRRFKLSHITKEDLISIVGSIAAQFKPESIQLGQPAVFAKASGPITYVAPADPNSFTAIHQALLTALGTKVTTRDPHFEKENFKPHMTLSYEGEAILSSDIPKEFFFSSFTLMEELDSTQELWQTVTIFDLK
jgi:2'-5' RNA ligase